MVRTILHSMAKRYSRCRFSPLNLLSVRVTILEVSPVSVAARFDLDWPNSDLARYYLSSIHSSCLSTGAC